MSGQLMFIECGTASTDVFILNDADSNRPKSLGQHSSWPRISTAVTHMTFPFFSGPEETFSVSGKQQKKKPLWLPSEHSDFWKSHFNEIIVEACRSSQRRKFLRVSTLRVKKVFFFFSLINFEATAGRETLSKFHETTAQDEGALERCGPRGRLLFASRLAGLHCAAGPIVLLCLRSAAIRSMEAIIAKSWTFTEK